MSESAITKLRNLIIQLRNAETGDPWMAALDIKTLAQLTIEESYELADSIDGGDTAEIKGELGDVFFHLMLYIQINEELNASSEDNNVTFNLEELAKSALDKQLRRRVSFKGKDIKTPEAALAQWEQNKAAERQQQNNKSTSVLDGIANNLPSINQALKLQQQAATVGFDWKDYQDVIAKIDEEVAELKAELKHDQKHDIEKITAELGDVLYTVINLARKLQINPDVALRHSNQKFISRFKQIEDIMRDRNSHIKDLSFAEALELWEQVKQKEL